MPLLIEQQGPVGIFTLSRPAARNAWDEDYNQEFVRVLPEWQEDESIRCIVVTGDEAGRAFSAGANLSPQNAHAAGTAADFIRDLPKAKQFVPTMLSEYPKPVIAAVNGYAIGIGCITTFSCDLIVASARAEWRLPQVALGILPAYGGATRLSRWIGRGLAMRAAMGFPIGADEAYRIGLAQWLVPHQDLMAQTMAVAEHIAALPPLAARMVKESINRGTDMASIGDTALADAYRFFVLALTEDKAEAHSAWRERRPPRITGR